MPHPNQQFCQHCGYENNARNNFCARCGRPIRSSRDFRAAGAGKTGRTRGKDMTCPGIDMEPVAVGGATWRLSPAQARPALCTDPVCPQCGRVNDPGMKHCKSCGLIISRDLRIDIFEKYVLIKVNMKELDFENSRILTQAFKNLSSKKRVIVDLGNVSFIDSSGIGALVTQTLRWGRYSADIKVIGLQPRVREAVRLMQVDNVLEISDNLLQCLADWGLAPGDSECTCFAKYQ